MAEKNFVRSMFNNIAPTYDKLNHILSLNIDKIWRKKAVKRIVKNLKNSETENLKNDSQVFRFSDSQIQKDSQILDVACGTADSTIALAKAGISSVTGVDISEEMLKVGETKVAAQNLDSVITLQVEDCENLSFDDDSFDAAFIAFGIRNFEDKRNGLRELRRVLKPNGHLLILELSVPQNKILLSLYKLYFLHILPFIGKKISGDSMAYTYLPQSVMNFPKPKDFLAMMEECGFKDVRQKALTFGLCRIFEGFV
ncbi:MAG: bifunctional demethylmenaquinone methyltransferase/2-methoxy-6-polyprenyl-1,4-benzoquinol methylase UbiE [Lentimicrobiaceae bacterium]|nr:bifunctional demethylmenaquinone methyltransferase/2-methoxy-6-polyprenyl-1,4-benzoquinol methylase UbiE [Lentimicrobiaceae bacterium]